MQTNEKDIASWFQDQYKKAVDLDELEGSYKYKTFINSFPVSTATGLFPLTGGRKRMTNFLRLKMEKIIELQGYNCRVLSIKLGNLSTNYAQVFWPHYDDPSKVYPQYICISPTFQSRDGEYRHRLIEYQKFIEATGKFATEFAPYESFILQLLSENVIELQNSVYGKDAELIEEKVKEDRLPIMALASALMLDSVNCMRGLLAIHVNKNYSTIMNQLADLVPELQQIATCSNELRNIIIKGTSSAIPCGEKMVPLFARETQRPFDYNLSAWRELEVSRIVTDPVIKFMSPSFAIYNQWSYFENISPKLFENTAMHERFVRAHESAIAVDKIREGRSSLKNVTLPNYYSEELSAHLYEDLEYAQSFLTMSNDVLWHTMEHVGMTMQSWPSYIRRTNVPVLGSIELFNEIDSAAHILFEYAYAAHCLHNIGIVHGDLHSNNITILHWGVYGKKVSPDSTEIRPYYENPVAMYVTGPRGEADSYVFPTAGMAGCLIDYSRAILGPAYSSRLEAGRDARYATSFYRDQVNRVMRTLHRYAPSYVAANQDAIKGAAYSDFESVFQVLCAVDFIAIGASVADVFVAQQAAAASAAAPQQAATDVKVVRPFTFTPEIIPLARKLESAGREALISGLHRIVKASQKMGGDPEDASQNLFTHVVDSTEQIGIPNSDIDEDFKKEFPALYSAFQEDARANCSSSNVTANCSSSNVTANCSSSNVTANCSKSNLPTHTNGGRESPVFPGNKIMETVFSKYLFTNWASGSVKKSQLVDAYNFNNISKNISSIDYGSWPKWARLNEIEKHLGPLKMNELFANGTEGFLETLAGRDIPIEIIAANARAESERLDGEEVTTASSWLDA